MGNVAPKFTRECCSPSFAVEREPANASSSASASPASRSAAYPTTPQRYGTIVMQEFSMSTPRGSDMKAEASIMRLAEAFERDKHEAETMHEEEKIALHKRLAALEHELASVASTTPSPTPTPNVHVSFRHTNLLLLFTHHTDAHCPKCPPSAHHKRRACVPNASAHFSSHVPTTYVRSDCALLTPARASRV